MTSQIFANIYLNEFDRFVRHTIKPLGYLRYGDDFIVLLPALPATLAAQQLATGWLADNLRLVVHTKNNVVLRASQGLYFLGHKIYPHSPLSVDATMLRKLRRDISAANLSSYRAMALPRKQQKLLPWMIFGKKSL